MLTSDAQPAGRAYSTRRRTAVILTGTGTAGAYHAGVLRALHEAGVKIDLVAARGAGVIGALFAAMDGGARLWEANGIWRSPAALAFYGWRRPLQAAGWALVAAAAVFALPLVLLALAVLVGLAGLVLALVGFENTGAAMTARFSVWVAALFAPTALPVVVPRLAVFALLVAIALLAIGGLADGLGRRGRRRTRQGLVWRLIGAPLTSSAVVHHSATELWNLIRGAAPLASPGPVELARRYVELLAENLGQPGFREILLTVHDLDTRRDLVFALLEPARRATFFGRRGVTGSEDRLAETFDLSGVARDHTLDVFAAALSVPVATEPALVTFAPEGTWRGETHRLCDRPGALARLLEEVALAGAEQVIVVAATAPPAKAHELSSGRSDVRGRAGEPLAAFETASLRSATAHFAGRFPGLFVIRPDHNPLGPLDFRGVYDERSDRLHTVTELVDGGYEDAYHQFIEPVLSEGEVRT